MDAVNPHRSRESQARPAALLLLVTLIMTMIAGFATAAPASTTVDDLIGQVEALVGDGGLSPGHGNSLIAKLQAAGRSLDRGRGSPACGELGAFTNHLEALAKTGKLRLDAAQSLSSQVMALSRQAQCSRIGRTVLIGAALSETGRFAEEGREVRQGYELWKEWINEEHGGINVGGDRYQVEIVYSDDESDADVAADAVERLITEDGVDFLLGPYSSGLTMATSAVAEDHGVIMVEGNGAVDLIFERGFRNIFGVLTLATRYAESAVDLLAGHGAETAVIFYEDTAFPTSVGQGAVRWAEENGMEVLAEASYPMDTGDVSDHFSEFRDLDPDIFVGGGHFNDALLFIETARELDWSPDGMVVTVGASDPAFVAELGAAAEYTIGITQWEATMLWDGDWFGTPGDYAARYLARWGEPAGYRAAESTAAALSLMVAIENAGSIDTDAVRQALYDLDIMTFYGPIDFDETGRNAAKTMGVVQIQDGLITVVAPPGTATAPLVYPMPPWDER